MNNALLIGYFPGNPLLRGFYNLLSVEIREFGFALTGVELGRNTTDHYQFPIVSLGAPRPGRLARVLAKLERKSSLLANSTLRCYGEMQAQQTDLRAVENEMRLLQNFRKRLERHCQEAEVRLVILNHHFSGYHLIAREVCVRRGIQFFYWHPGFLPGTMSFDRLGQMAESEINDRLREEIDRCGADEEQVGENYRRWVHEQSYTRPGKKALSDAACLREIEALARKFKRVLLVIGSNDYHTGMLPESYPQAKRHSAVIRSSRVLYEKAMEGTGESTLVVYKPHPNLNPTTSGIEMISERSCRIFDVTIKDLLPLVNATVTLCSAAAYEALILGVPTVIVGNLPGSDLGICYKPDAENFDLKPVLQTALTGEIPPVMKKRLNVLMGFLIKHYFFSAGSGACPLVERSLKTALSEVLTGKGCPHAAIPATPVHHPAQAS